MKAKSLIATVALVVGGMIATAVPAHAETVPKPTIPLPPTTQQFVDEFNAAPDGTTLVREVSGQTEVSIVKRDGRAVVETEDVSAPGTDDGDIAVQADGFCTWAVTGAIYALGGAALVALAATGGAEIAGVFIAGDLLNMIGNAAIVGGSVDTLVAQYVC